MYAAGIDYTDCAVADLRKQVESQGNRLDRRIDGAIANAMAVPVLPAMYRGERAMAMAVGSYGSASAIGVAVGTVRDDGTLISGSVSLGAGKPAMKMNAGWKF